jgi:hypothetical protein
VTDPATEGSSCECVVSDSGCGISAADHPDQSLCSLTSFGKRDF